MSMSLQGAANQIERKRKVSQIVVLVVAVVVVSNGGTYDKPDI